MTIAFQALKPIKIHEKNMMHFVKRVKTIVINFKNVEDEQFVKNIFNILDKMIKNMFGLSTIEIQNLKKMNGLLESSFPSKRIDNLIFKSCDFKDKLNEISTKPQSRVNNVDLSFDNISTSNGKNILKNWTDYLRHNIKNTLPSLSLIGRGKRRSHKFSKRKRVRRNKTKKKQSKHFS